MSTLNGACNLPNDDEGGGKNNGKINDLLNSEKVAILDCGGQFAKLFDRKMCKLNVESQILPLNTPAKELLKKQYK